MQQPKRTSEKASDSEPCAWESTRSVVVPRAPSEHLGPEIWRLSGRLVAIQILDNALHHGHDGPRRVQAASRKVLHDSVPVSLQTEEAHVCSRVARAGYADMHLQATVWCTELTQWQCKNDGAPKRSSGCAAAACAPAFAASLPLASPSSAPRRWRCLAPAARVGRFRAGCAMALCTAFVISMRAASALE